MSNQAAMARFTTGSTMRHVVEMTVTGAIGIMAIFLVDFLSLFYISRLKNDALTAGVGYATTVLFIAISANIGAMIAGTALVSRALGEASRAPAEQVANAQDEAHRLAGVAMVLIMLFAAAMALLLWLVAPSLLSALGAPAPALAVALSFLHITLPANVLMGAGMMLSGLLRAKGDSRRAMNVTLFGGLVTAVADPLLIFVAGLGTDGAAWATLISRVVFAWVGWHGAARVHGMLRMVSLAEIGRDAGRFAAIAGPAILTNLATPVGSLFFLRVVTGFGPSAVAASAILDRVVPVAFGVLFALSASVGPILGQNLGANLHHRLRQAMRDSYVFGGGYAVAAALLLALINQPIVSFFGATGETAEMLSTFCLYGGLAWVFIGLVLVSNAAFNNLGFPLYSTGFNWGRATLGTFPTAWYGAQWFGIKGALIGITLGNAVFGLVSVIAVFSAIRSIEHRRSAEQAIAEPRQNR